MTEILKIGGMVALGLFLIVFLFVFLRYANLYLQSILTKAKIGLFEMFAMGLRKVKPGIIVNAKIMLVQARDISVEAWEKQNPGSDVFEDRGLEITSQAEIDVEVQIAAVKAAIAAKDETKKAKMA